MISGRSSVTILISKTMGLGEIEASGEIKYSPDL
ncbi:MAG: hypothetical protein JWO71_1329 [Candidatus Acidoferrum typicum]|nr:hypothetical protein [Candidatus Acidoferrum typicum]